MNPPKILTMTPEDAKYIDPTKINGIIMNNGSIIKVSDNCPLPQQQFHYQINENNIILEGDNLLFYESGGSLYAPNLNYSKSVKNISTFKSSAKPSMSCPLCDKNNTCPVCSRIEAYKTLKSKPVNKQEEIVKTLPLNKRFYYYKKGKDRSVKKTNVDKNIDPESTRVVRKTVKNNGSVLRTVPLTDERTSNKRIFRSSSSFDNNDQRCPFHRCEGIRNDTNNAGYSKDNLRFYVSK